MAREQYQYYLQAALSIIEQYGGKIIARFESPSHTAAKAQGLYDSPGYRKARKLREGAGEGELIVFEGFQPGYSGQTKYA